MKYTYRELIERLKMNGCPLANIAVGQLMVIVGEETGKFPDYDEPAPDWAINHCLGGLDE